ncbi:MAG: hypothetical protein SGPRY_014166 [Prymnesium sp.]
MERMKALRLLEPCAPPPPLHPLPPQTEVIRRVQLTGGLFNQLWSLQTLVRDAYDTRRPLILPSFESHLPSEAMGIKRTRANAPSILTFDRLFSFDCFAASLREHGVVVLLDPPPSPARFVAPLNSSKQGSRLVIKLFTKYTQHLDDRLHGRTPPHPIEDVVYAALRPSRRLSLKVASFLNSSGLAAHPYGCVHARIENDMRRWWYHVGRVKPLSFAAIAELVGSVRALQDTKAIFVAVGSDIRGVDEEALSRGVSPWNATLVRRKRRGDASGSIVNSAAGGEEDSLTYAESALVDASLCRSASWFAGWTSSSFSATLAHYRLLDEPGGRGGTYYAYCGAPRPSIGLRHARGVVHMHTCREAKGGENSSSLRGRSSHVERANVSALSSESAPSGPLLMLGKAVSAVDTGFSTAALSVSWKQLEARSMLSPGLLAAQADGVIKRWPGSGDSNGLLCGADRAAVPFACASSIGNPEMRAGLEAQNGPNYAHWMFAFVYPLISLLDSTLNITGADNVNVFLSWGRNVRYRFFNDQIRQVLNLSCSYGKFASLAAHDGEHCATMGRLHVHRLAWYSHPFWRNARAFAASLSRRLGVERAPIRCEGEASVRSAARVLILLRNNGTKEAKNRHVWGLERACTAEYTKLSPSHFGAQIECLRLSRSVPMRQTASAFSGSDVRPTIGLIAGHGAGLANVVFLRPGAVMIEIDAAFNARNDRNMFQLLSYHTGIHAYKLWLNRLGVRYFPEVTPVRIRPSIHNASIPAIQQGCYCQSVTILPQMLDESVRNASSLARGCDDYRAVAAWAQQAAEMDHRNL